MKVRKATIGDLPAVRSVMRVLRVPGVPWADWHTVRMIRTVLLEGRYYCMELGGRIVGAMSVEECARGELEIATLAVRRSACRKRVGTALVRFARQLARRRGKKRIVVSSACMYGARPFYERQGFRVRSSGTYRGKRWHEFVLKA